MAVTKTLAQILLLLEKSQFRSSYKLLCKAKSKQSCLSNNYVITGLWNDQGESVIILD